MGCRAGIFEKVKVEIKFDLTKPIMIGYKCVAKSRMRGETTRSQASLRNGAFLLFIINIQCDHIGC